MKISNNWLLFLLGTAILIILYLAYQLYFSSGQNLIGKRSTVPPAGVCITKKPTSGDYLHVKISVKAKDINVRYFMWHGLDYAWRCFPTTDDTHTFDGYVPNYPGEAIPFDVLLSSGSNDNPVEYSIKVFDANERLIRKVPAIDSVGKTKANQTGWCDLGDVIPAQH